MPLETTPPLKPEFEKSADGAQPKKRKPPFSLRFSDADRARLEHDAAGMSLAAYVRWRLFDPENNGTTFMDETVTPHEGKMFFVRGFIGMIALPVFLGIVFAILGEQIPFTSQWIWLAGFVLGSTGVEYLIYQEQQEQQEKAKAQGAVVLPPLPDHQPSKPHVTPTVEPVKPFRFASWEDEEQGR
ncbi:MAG: hypothetical protein AB7E05_11880 [Sphingobium sp.]